MQFKHPEILWALLLLLIPIFIHLFQLRRFKKTPFTNVAMLQKVIAESRKSKQLKKWLLLANRLLLLAALVTAFAQPYFASRLAQIEKQTVIYLDNSFSMQAKDNGLSMLELAVQELVKHAQEDEVFSLFTNENTYKNVTIKEIQNDLLSLRYSPNQLNLETIGLKAKSLFESSSETIKNTIVISDFQSYDETDVTDLDSLLQWYFVPYQSQLKRNISIDSIALEDHLTEPSELVVRLSGGALDESLPISLFNSEQLIAKSSAQFSENGRAEVLFTIPSNTELQGELSIQDNGLTFDNSFYFNVDRKEKVKVLAINNTDTNFLQRLFKSEEFVYEEYKLNQLDYSAIDNQNTVILNGLNSIPNGLQPILRTFHQSGGTVIVIPSTEIDLTSYNNFISRFRASRLGPLQVQTKNINEISFDHPVYREVFEKRVQNFQYPSAESCFSLSTTFPKVLGFDDSSSFLAGIDGFYLFTASLSDDNSNFINSPLIVPTFYNMVSFSLKAPSVQHTLGLPYSMDISMKLEGDAILRVAKDNYEFIPRQQSFPNKVRLDFEENPLEDGIYRIDNSGETVRRISFNYPRTESSLNYWELGDLNRISMKDNVSSLFEDLKAQNSITPYWKWFVILALFFALAEMLIQKFVS
ncbi:BatA domain-containing protein [Muricauda sp. 2012CJ35-5]|uniref:BatA domain-containing protein n=1 Tax=Flagellimonas spongiicola TaxID=2942208 RepID=A0ABT0PQE2_9FLAO|nr:BatA domain-containing protein [Allomuricauda spongiicola]MCL6273511.1 BatA domain-containing protein [Allomuricauda spongiicola]